MSSNRIDERDSLAPKYIKVGLQNSQQNGSPSPLHDNLQVHLNKHDHLLFHIIMRSSETMKIRPICIRIRFLLSLLFLFGALAFPAAPSVHQAQPRSMLQPPLPQKTIPPSILDLEIRDTQTASISNAFPTAAAAATTANALTNPYCSYLDSVLSVCNFATPGFSSYSPAYQAECLCYVDGIWEPFLFDGEISMCVGYLIAQTTGDRASMVDIMTLMGLCFSVGNVKTCTYTGSDVSSCSAGEASASSRATSSEPAASSSNAAASQSNAAESFLTSIPTITSGTIYTSSQSLPIPPLTPIPTIIYGTQSLPIPPLTPIPTIIYWTIYTSSQSFNTNSMPTAISSKDLTGATPTTTNISSRPIGILGKFNSIQIL
jgi:hypothetical protein